MQHRSLREQASKRGREEGGRQTPMLSHRGLCVGQGVVANKSTGPPRPSSLPSLWWTPSPSLPLRPLNPPPHTPHHRWLGGGGGQEGWGSGGDRWKKGRGLARDRKGSLHFSLSFFFVSKLRLTLMRSDIIFFFF